MGTKFANIHVLHEDIEEIKCALISVNETKPKMNIQALQGLFGRELEQESLELFSSISNRTQTYYIGSFLSNWFTILNPDISWGSVNDSAIEISNSLNTTVLSVGYFDDDVFELCLINNGEILTKQLACSEATAEDYGLDLCILDANVFTETLNIQVDKTHFYEVLESEDLEEQVHYLEDVLHLPLWIKADWFEHFDEEVKNKFKVFTV